MVIQSSTHTYVAIQKLESRRIRQYLCRRIAPGEDRECRVAEVPNEYAPELVPYLKARRDGGAFTDLLDFFTDGEKLYIVTAARTFLSLKERLEGSKCSLAERMAVMKNLLAELLLQGMDDFFCQAALEAPAIGVSASLEIGLQYDLDDIADHSRVSFGTVQHRLSEIVEALFETELKQEALPQIRELKERLRQGTFSDLLSVYSWFLTLAEAWTSGKERELKPMGFWFRVWERLKLLAGGLVWLWKMLLILLAAGYLICSVKLFFAEPASAVNFKQIGTLMIE